MRVLDLFSGIGGFSLGLERAGMETVAFCEIDPYCRKVLAKHWPDAPIHDDIRTLQGDEYGPVELICGGYPCQPFSTAGKRSGAKDDRHLWPEMHRIVWEVRPDWVICENVAGHISMGLDQVLSDLENSGYTTQTFVIPACAVDAPHRRDRVWIVANTQGKRRGEKRADSKRPEERITGGGPVSDTSSEGLQRDARQRLRSIQCEEGTSPRGESCGTYATGGRTWPTEPAVGRVADGIPYRVDRLRALGNAVVPQIPDILGRAIMAIEHDT